MIRCGRPTAGMVDRLFYVDTPTHSDWAATPCVLAVKSGTMRASIFR